MSDLLAPKRKDIGEQYEVEFRGMIREPTSLEALVETREQLIHTIHSAMTDDDRALLMSVEERKPDWLLIDLPSIERLPAVRWKLCKLGKMSKEKHDASVRRLATVLEGSEISS